MRLAQRERERDECLRSHSTNKTLQSHTQLTHSALTLNHNRIFCQSKCQTALNYQPKLQNIEGGWDQLHSGVCTACLLITSVSLNTVCVCVCVCVCVGIWGVCEFVSVCVC